MVRKEPRPGLLTWGRSGGRHAHGQGPVDSSLIPGGDLSRLGRLSPSQTCKYHALERGLGAPDPGKPARVVFLEKLGLSGTSTRPSSG